MDGGAWWAIVHIPWRRKWQPTPAFLPKKSHGWRSLVGCSPYDRKRVRHDLATKQQHIYFTIIKKDGRGGKKSNNVRASNDTPFYSVPGRFLLPSLGRVWLVLQCLSLAVVLSLTVYLHHFQDILSLFQVKPLHL